MMSRLKWVSFVLGKEERHSMAASKQPLRLHLTSTMKLATSNTLVSMRILPVAAILMALEAWVTSKSGLIMASEV